MAFEPSTFFSDPDTAPPAAIHLGWSYIDADVERGWIKIGFSPKQEFLNPAGNVQGGFLIAMLDDTMGPAVVCMSHGTQFTSSIDIHAHFLRPVKLGPVTCEAEVTRKGRNIAYAEGKLYDADGKLCVRAVTSAMLLDFPGSTS